jgi:AraC family transcriptional regulator
MRRPIDNARQVTGAEPLARLESWSEKHFEVAVWRLQPPRTLKVENSNHFTCFALTPIGNHVLRDDRGKLLRAGPVAAGRFRLVQGPARFESELSSNRPVEMLYIFFSTRLIHQIAADLGQRAKDIVLTDPLWEERDDLLERLALSVAEDMQSTSLTDRLVAQETAMLILRRLLARHSNLKDASGSRVLAEHDFRWAIKFMIDNIDKPVSVEQLAALADMTRFAFIRGFTKVYGTTPMRHLRQLRLERAKEMLVHTSLPIAAVSHRLGFSDAAHFVVAFRRGSGMTPRAYRLAQTQSTRA